MLRFDNTYSWTRSKELFYTIRVLPPDTELVRSEQEEERREDDEEVTEQEFADCAEDPPQTDDITKAVDSMNLEPPT